MWIAQIDLTNFRSYVSGNIELSKGINLIVGQNNSGKTTLLKSVAWLQVGANISFQDIRKMEQNGSVKLDFVNGKRYFGIADSSPVTIIVNLSNQGLTFYNPINGSIGINALDHISPSYDGDAFSSRYPFRIPNQEPNNFIYPYLSKRKVTHFEEAINSQAAASVSGNFSCLSAKVDRLCDSTIPEHKEFVESCNEIIGFQLSAVASPGGKKAARAINAHERIYLEEMGEGVANLLGLIVDLCVAKDKLFLIEELENDIHPKALKKLLDLIEKKSKTNQFIITTHSNIVVKHLGSLSESKLFQVTMDRDENLIPTSKVEAVENTPEARLQILSDLGYDLFDSGIWSGWLFLEESSAERIIREYLIPWFTPRLANRLKTVAAQGKDDVEPKFQDFHRLFLFVHLEPIYRDSAWVVIDGGVEEEVIIDKLKAKFSSWDSSHFRQFRQHDFESYYPNEFDRNLQVKIDEISKLTNKKEKMKQKKAILDDILIWIKEDEEVAKNAFENSASEVINILKEIDSKLIKS
jgi:predicted ATPase